VSVARHVRAILLLPFVNTVVVPAALLVANGARVPRVAATTTGIALLAAGVLLLAAGVALASEAIRAFALRGNGTLAPWDPARTLLASGVYARTRNPLKLGLFAILGGEALLAQSPALAAWLALFALANVIYIRVSEEPGLRHRFGPSYEAYCARVPRWWPKLAVRRELEWTPVEKR
jgi:protein-S-isoprenylcysteine O-methyltransferase Ste14